MKWLTRKLWEIEAYLRRLESRIDAKRKKMNEEAEAERIQRDYRKKMF